MSTINFSEQLLRQMNLLAACSEAETDSKLLSDLSREICSTATSILLYENSEANCKKIREVFRKQLYLLCERSSVETDSADLIILTREIRELMYKIEDPVYPQRDPG